MQTTLALAALVAVASSQAVTSLITPDSSEPAGFSESYSGSFEITAVAAATEKRDLSKVSSIENFSRRALVLT